MSYLSVSEGETACVKCSIGFEPIAGQPKLEVIDSSVGSSETQRLKFNGDF